VKGFVAGKLTGLIEQAVARHLLDLAHLRSDEGIPISRAR